MKTHHIPLLEDDDFVQTPINKGKAVHRNVDEINLEDYDLPKLLDSPICDTLVKLVLHVPDLMIIPPNLFEHMPMLQVLDLSNTKILSLPKSISNLSLLQKFFLRDCSYLMELPSQIERLSKLKLFDINGTELMFIPKEMGELKDLEVLRVTLSHYAKHYIKTNSANETVIPKQMISKLKQLKELCVIISVGPEPEWWEEEVTDLQKELCDLKNLETLRWYLPTNKVFQQFLLLKRNDVPLYGTLSNLMLTIGHHAQLTSCLPRDLEKKFEEFKNCIIWRNGEENMDEISKIMASAKALLLSRHWSVEMLSNFNVTNLKYCLLAECNNMETLVEVDGLSDDVETRIKNGKTVSLEFLKYLSIYHMNKLHSIWKGPIGKSSLSKLRIMALHTCPQLTCIFTPTIAQNLSCLIELTVEDCPKVISIMSGESHKYGSIFPSLEKIFLLDLPMLVNIFVGDIVLEMLRTLFVYSCLQLKDLSNMKLPRLEKIEGQPNWWKGVYNNSMWNDIFEPLKKRSDLIKQLFEAKNSLQHYFDGKSQVFNQETDDDFGIHLAMKMKTTHHIPLLADDDFVQTPLDDFVQTPLNQGEAELENIADTGVATEMARSGEISAQKISVMDVVRSWLVLIFLGERLVMQKLGIKPTYFFVVRWFILMIMIFIVCNWLTHTLVTFMHRPL